MNLRWNAAGAAIVAAATIGNMPSSFAFVAKSHSPLSSTASKASSRSTLYMGPPKDPSAPITELYGEGSRKYRRTVYTHNEWVKHRSPDRFGRNLATLINSGIYKNIGREVVACTAVATFVCGWNLLVGGYQDFSGVMHDPILDQPVSARYSSDVLPNTISSSHDDYADISFSCYPFH